MNFTFALSVICLGLASAAGAFEGRIAAETTQGGHTEALLYIVSADFVRMEITNATNGPTPVDILDMKSGQLTLLFPQNRGFVRLPSTAETNAVVSGARLSVAAPGPGAFATAPAMPAMPMMPMPAEKMELQGTGQTTNLLGLACGRYEIKQRGETMEIWATDQLLPYKPYVPNQPHPGGPRGTEDQWQVLLAAQKLFPLRVSLRRSNGAERFRFEVKSVTPTKLSDEDAKLFQPPPGYFETRPLPF